MHLHNVVVIHEKSNTAVLYKTNNDIKKRSQYQTFHVPIDDIAPFGLDGPYY